MPPRAARRTQACWATSRPPTAWTVSGGGPQPVSVQDKLHRTPAAAHQQTGAAACAVQEVAALNCLTAAVTEPVSRAVARKAASKGGERGGAGGKAATADGHSQPNPLASSLPSRLTSQLRQRLVGGSGSTAGHGSGSSAGVTAVTAKRGAGEPAAAMTDGVDGGDDDVEAQRGVTAKGTTSPPAKAITAAAGAMAGAGGGGGGQHGSKRQILHSISGRVKPGACGWLIQAGFPAASSSFMILAGIHEEQRAHPTQCTH